MPDVCLTDLVGFLRSTFLAHQPSVHARMTNPGYDAKYYRVPTPIDDADLCAHLAGEITLASQLANDGLAWTAACDIDRGGLPVLRAVMQAAEARNCHAYGFALTSDTHDGGHVWLVFDQPHPIRDLQALMRDILSAAGVAGAEVYPSAADLRLPFGMHRRCGRRGDLLLSSSAMPIPIDPDPLAALAHFAAHLQRTGSAPVVQARSIQDERQRQLDAQIAEARAAQPRLSIGGQPTGIEIIQAFNASTDLVRLLEQYGGTVAYRYAERKVLMHCAATQDHHNGDKHPSLIVQPGTGRQTGKLICGCYSPTCRLHNDPGQIKDPFEVYCIMEGIDHREGVKRLSRTYNPTPTRGYRSSGGAASGRRSFSPTPANPTPAPQRQSPGAPAQPTVSTTNPGSPWRTAAQSRLEQLRRLPAARPMDKQLFGYLIERCNTQPSCRPSNAAAAADLGVCTGTIKLTKRRLTQLGYIAVTPSQDGKSTSIVTLILPVMLPALIEEQTEGVIEGVIPRSPESKLRIESTKKGGGSTLLITPLLPETETTLTGSAEPAVVTQPKTRTAGRQQRYQSRTTEALISERAQLLAKSHETSNHRQRYVLRQLATEIETELTQRGVAVAELARYRTGTPQADRQEVITPPAPAYAPKDRAALHQQPGIELNSAAVPAVTPHQQPCVPAVRQLLASPAAPHPALTTEQATALVRSGLRMRLPSMRRALIDQIWVQLRGDTLLINCPLGCSEQQVSQVLLPHIATVLDDQGISSVRSISIARSAETLKVTLTPAWLSPEVWTAMPVGLRDVLVGSIWVQGVLYGATSIQTAMLNEDSTGAIDHIIATYAAEYRPLLAPTAQLVSASVNQGIMLRERVLPVEPCPLVIQDLDAGVSSQTAVLIPPKPHQPEAPCDKLRFSVCLTPDTPPMQPIYNGAVIPAAENGVAGMASEVNRGHLVSDVPHEGHVADASPLGFAIQRQTNARDRIVPGTAMQETMQSASGIASANGIGHRRQRRLYAAYRVGCSRQIVIFGSPHVGYTRQTVIRAMVVIRQSTDAHTGIAHESPADSAPGTVTVIELARLMADRNEEGESGCWHAESMLRAFLRHFS